VFRKIVTAVILVPIALIIVMFAVANREIITVTFDPFDSKNPAFALTLPLFMLVFVLVGLGILIGGMAAWLKQHKWRVRARRAEADERRLRTELDAQRARSVQPVVEHPPLILPPAA
ncbi:unnamed protein product, partial [Phaeothamnion confervicola]